MVCLVLLITNMHKPFLKRQILDLFQTERVCVGDNFKFDEIGRKLFKWVETLWENEKLLVTSISPLPTVLSKALYCRHDKKPWLVWERVKTAFVRVWFLYSI